MTQPPTAVLLSAGLDSAVLAAVESRTSLVQPVYVSSGLAWERQELDALAVLLRSEPFLGRTAPVAQLALTMSDVYPATHWALRGTPPAFDTPDEDVYLAGRNIILLAKTAVFCNQRGIGRIALGPLAGNPFPDATPRFFETIAAALSLGLGQPIRVDTPFASMSKKEVIRLGLELGVPLELTLSCMNPQGAQHCGRCSKCRERRDAFRDARAEDRTVYASTPPR